MAGNVSRWVIGWVGDWVGGGAQVDEWQGIVSMLLLAVLVAVYVTYVRSTGLYTRMNTASCWSCMCRRTHMLLSSRCAGTAREALCGCVGADDAICCCWSGMVVWACGG